MEGPTSRYTPVGRPRGFRSTTPVPLPRAPSRTRTFAETRSRTPAPPVRLLPEAPRSSAPPSVPREYAREEFRRPAAPPPPPPRAAPRAPSAPRRSQADYARAAEYSHRGPAHPAPRMPSGFYMPGARPLPGDWVPPSSRAPPAAAAPPPRAPARAQPIQVTTANIMSPEVTSADIRAFFGLDIPAAKKAIKKFIVAGRFHPDMKGDVGVFQALGDKIDLAYNPRDVDGSTLPGGYGRMIGSSRGMGRCKRCCFCKRCNCCKKCGRYKY